jgi:phosphotransferase system HPr (HPr) family protein
LKDEETRFILTGSIRCSSFTLLPTSEGKSALTLALGCTGGTVPRVLVEELRKDLAARIIASTSSTGHRQQPHEQSRQETRDQEQVGLHAQAAALLVQTRIGSARVNFSKDGQTADGRSIMGVLILAGTRSKIQVEAIGEDAERRG